MLDLEGTNGRRNQRFTDAWSLVHVAAGFGWGLVTKRPRRAWLLMAAWEPFEVLVLSPWLERRLRILYGKEGWRNVLGDLFYDAVGVLAARLVLRRWDPFGVRPQGPLAEIVTRSSNGAHPDRGAEPADGPVPSFVPAALPADGGEAEDKPLEGFEPPTA